MKDKQYFKNIHHIWSDDHQTCYRYSYVSDQSISSISNEFKRTFLFCIQGIPLKKKKKRGLTSPLSVVIVAQNEWLPFVGSFELVIICQWGRLYLISNVWKKLKNAEWKSHLRIRLDMLQNLSLISTDCDFFLLYF